MLTRELRRLAEVERVDAIVAAGTGPDEVVMREVARSHPDVVFLPVVHGPREVTGGIRAASRGRSPPRRAHRHDH
jgi:hypothetical protein